MWGKGHQVNVLPRAANWPGPAMVDASVWGDMHLRCEPSFLQQNNFQNKGRKPDLNLC